MKRKVTLKHRTFAMGEEFNSAMDQMESAVSKILIAHANGEAVPLTIGPFAPKGSSRDHDIKSCRIYKCLACIALGKKF